MKNRAIDKYRVWDEEMKEYVSSLVFINHHGEVCLIKNGCFYPNKTTKEHCTGLKDKNGKLIFEGDVVKTKDFGKDIDNRINVNDYDTFVVKFHECGFYIENDSRRFPMTYRPKLEIIGNIHEYSADA